MNKIAGHHDIYMITKEDQQNNVYYKSNYFNALYFRESGEILFEIATDPPGFAHEEALETMGTQLMLPAQYEHNRDQLVNSLIPIQVRPID